MKFLFVFLVILSPALCEKKPKPQPEERCSEGICVVGLRWSRDSSGLESLVGAVVNRRSSPIWMVTVNLQLMQDNGVATGTCLDVFNGTLGAGERWAFRALRVSPGFPAFARIERVEANLKEDGAAKASRKAFLIDYRAPRKFKFFGD